MCTFLPTASAGVLVDRIEGGGLGCVGQSSHCVQDIENLASASDVWLTFLPCRLGAFARGGWVLITFTCGSGNRLRDCQFQTRVMCCSLWELARACLGAHEVMVTNRVLQRCAGNTKSRVVEEQFC